jgi:chaperonin GroEL (HSP60 family)
LARSFPCAKPQGQACRQGLLARALEEPLRQIVENAGEDAAVVLDAVKGGQGS